MDGHRPDALTDAALEREIEAVLAVDHSPEFRAKVRASVAGSSAPAPWRLGRRLFPAGVGLCAAAALALLWAVSEPAVTVAPVGVRAPGVPSSSHPHVLGPSKGGPRVGAAVPIPGPTTIEPERVASAVVAAPRLGRLKAVPTADFDAPPFPEVIISAEETRALGLLLTSVQRGRMPAMPETERPDADQLLVLDDVKVATLVIEPLALRAQVEGERR